MRHPAGAGGLVQAGRGDDRRRGGPASGRPIPAAASAPCSSTPADPATAPPGTSWPPRPTSPRRSVPVRHRRHGSARASAPAPRSGAACRCSRPTLTLFPRTRQEFDRLCAAQPRGRRELPAGRRRPGPALRHRQRRPRPRGAAHRAGRRQVNWLVLSYGTQIAANYAALLPEPDPGDGARRRPGTQRCPRSCRRPRRSGTVENAFNRFARWCDTAPDCALRGQDVAAVYDRLVARANRHPMPVEGALRPVTGEDIRMGTPRLARSEGRRSSSAVPTCPGPALSRAHRSAPSPVTPSAFAFPPPAKAARTRIFGVAANGCGDYVVEVHDYGRDAAADPAGQAARAAPAGRLRDLAGRSCCIGWPVPAANPPRRLDVTRRADPDRARHARPVHLVQVGASGWRRRSAAAPC